MVRTYKFLLLINLVFSISFQMAFTVDNVTNGRLSYTNKQNIRPSILLYFKLSMMLFFSFCRPKNNIKLLLDWLWLNDFSINTLPSLQYMPSKCHSQPGIEPQKSEITYSHSVLCLSFYLEEHYSCCTPFVVCI